MALAKIRAQTQGFNVFAYHGTFNRFDEFGKCDIGFHFSNDIKLAINRANDIGLDLESGAKTPIILHVALSIHKPIVVKCDFNCWDAQDLFRAASMYLTGTPFLSPSVVYLTEQRQMARSAWRILRKLGYGRETALEING